MIGAHTFRIRRTLIPIVLGGLLGTACGAGGDSGEVSGSSGGSSAVGHQLTIAIGEEPRSMDTLLGAGGGADTFWLNVQEGLTTRNGSTIEPLLAETWEEQDGGYLFHLRNGIRFHDGSTLDAQDVVASYARLLSDNSELRGNYLDDDTEVSAVDDATVLIRRPTPDPTLLQRASLVMIVPSEWAALPDDRLTETMMGSGPYKFDRWDRGKEIHLSAYEDYWGKHPAIDDVTIKFLPEEATRLAALQNNEIQLAFNMSIDQQAEAPQILKGSASEVLVILLNTQHGPFTDERIREAANLAIDRKQLIDELYGGAAESAHSQPIAQYVFGASRTVEEIPYDPDRARELLEDAGAIGTQIWMASTSGRWSQDANVSSAIAAMWDAVGFDVRLETPEYSVWADLAYAGHTKPAEAPDAVPFNHSNQVFDASMSVNALVCDGAVSIYCNPEVEQLANEAEAEFDPQARERLYEQIWEIIREDSGFISVAEVKQVTFASSDVAYQPAPDGYLRFSLMSLTAG